MTWTSLLANKEAQKHGTSKKELDNMRALIARDLTDAGIAGLSADRRFATAYNAALPANMAIACAGYRITSKVGRHRVSLESTKLVLGKPMHKYADYFETVGGRETLSTTPSPTLRRRRKRRRSSSKHPSFTAKSRTGLRKITLH